MMLIVAARNQRNSVQQTFTGMVLSTQPILSHLIQLRQQPRRKVVS